MIKSDFINIFNEVLDNNSTSDLTGDKFYHALITSMQKELQQGGKIFLPNICVLSTKTLPARIRKVPLDIGSSHVRKIRVPAKKKLVCKVSKNLI